MSTFELCAANLERKTVLFRTNGPFFTDERETLLDGSVISADDDRRTAAICYLYGLKSYTDDVSYDKLVALVDPEAPRITIENFSGHMIDLQAHV